MGGQGLNPLSLGGSENVGAEESESTVTEDAVIEANRSVMDKLDRTYVSTARADDGTWFGLTQSGSTATLYRGDSIRSLSQINTFDESADKLEIHITAGGTILLGINGQMRRSTDDGDSFTSQHDISTIGTAWSISENDDGDIVATGGNPGTAVYRSSDDGVNWTEIADSTDLSNYPTHCHKARWLPGTNKLVVTGGDSNDPLGYYTSDDADTAADPSWTFHNTDNYAQWVGIGVHPTADRFILGSDTQNQPGWVIDENDVRVAALDLARYPENTGATGVFDFATIDNPNDRDESYYVGTVANPETPFLTWASHNIEAKSWRALGRTDSKVGGSTRVQGAYETIVDSTVVDEITQAEYAFHTGRGRDPLYGSAQMLPVDQRTVHNSLVFDDGTWPIDVSGAPAIARLCRLKEDGEDQIDIFYNNGRVIIENSTTDTELLRFYSTGTVDIRNGSLNVLNGPVQPKGNGVVMDPVDIRTVTGVRGRKGYHDGSGTNTEGPAHHDGDNWISTVDGSTIS